MIDNLSTVLQAIRQSTVLLRSTMQATIYTEEFHGLIDRRALLVSLGGIVGTMCLPKAAFAQHGGTGPAGSSGAAHGAMHSSAGAASANVQGAARSIAQASHTFCATNDHMLSCVTRSNPPSAEVSAEHASQSTDTEHSNMEPARKSLSTISIDPTRQNADSEGTESSSGTISKVHVNTQDILCSFMGLSATMLSLSSSKLKAIGPPLEGASNLYGAATAFGEVRNSDLSLGLAVTGAFANVGFGYASGAAAGAVATAVFETAVAFVAPPAAIAYAIGASATVLVGSNFVNSYVNEVTHSVLQTTINSLSEQQSAAEHNIYEYSRTPFAGRF
jgi:hypothetical protein